MRSKNVQEFKFPLVRVVWHDAESTDEWEDIKSDNPRACRPIVTVGHVIEDTEDHISLAMNYDPHNEKVSMVMVIPNFWIREISEL